MPKRNVGTHVLETDAAAAFRQHRRQAEENANALKQSAAVAAATARALERRLQAQQQRYDNAQEHNDDEFVDDIFRSHRREDDEGQDDAFPVTVAEAIEVKRLHDSLKRVEREDDLDLFELRLSAGFPWPEVFASFPGQKPEDWSGEEEGAPSEPASSGVLSSDWEAQDVEDEVEEPAHHHRGPRRKKPRSGPDVGYRWTCKALTTSGEQRRSFACGYVNRFLFSECASCGSPRCGGTSEQFTEQIDTAIEKLGDATAEEVLAHIAEEMGLRGVPEALEVRKTEVERRVLERNLPEFRILLQDHERIPCTSTTRTGLSLQVVRPRKSIVLDSELGSVRGIVGRRERRPELEDLITLEGIIERQDRYEKTVKRKLGLQQEGHVLTHRAMAAQYKVRRSVADASASLQELVKIRVGELLQTAWATRDQQTDVPQAIVDSVAGLLASTVGDNVNTLLTPLPLPDDAERRGRHKSDRYKYNSVPGFNVVPKGEGYKSALDLLSKQGVSRSILDTLSFTSS